MIPRPIKSIIIAPRSLLPPMRLALETTRASTPFVALITSAKPAATSITKAIKPISLIPSAIVLSTSLTLITRVSIKIKIPARPPRGIEPVKI